MHTPGASASPFSATKAKVANRGRPPDAFLQELVDWGRSAPDEVFAPNKENDIYSSVAAELGPYENLAQRRVVMLEMLRVHAVSGWSSHSKMQTTSYLKSSMC